MNAIEYQLAVQRATQAAIWGMPAVGIWDFVVATRRDLGGDIGDVVYFFQTNGVPSSNWITIGEPFFLLFRLYGPDKPLFEKRWKLADVEKVTYD